MQAISTAYYFNLATRDFMLADGGIESVVEANPWSALIDPVAKQRAYLLRPVGSAARKKTRFEGWQIPLRFARTLAGGGAVLGLTGATSIGK